MPPCIAGCGRPATTAVEAGLQLELCMDHLRALRRCCKGKQALRYAALAVREAARIVAAAASHRSGQTPAAYRCPLCTSWHVGHQPHGVDDVDPVAAQAAAAVRARLTARQLSTLTGAWRTAPRPHRVRHARRASRSAPAHPTDQTQE